MYSTECILFLLNIGSPRFARSWTDHDRKLVAWMVYSPQFTWVATVSLESTSLVSLFLISLIMGLYIFIMESVVFTPSYVVIALSVDALVHTNHQINAFILLFSYILSIRNKQRQDISWCQYLSQRVCKNFSCRKLHAVLVNINLSPR